jgi:UDPglucose 6-dehydrogenase
MKIGVVGLGYVGIVTAAVLADKGNDVIGVDISAERVEALRKGPTPIYEPGLKEMLKRNSNRLEFSSDYARLRGAAAVFIVVPTPTLNGKINLSYVKDAAGRVAAVEKSAVLVIKSTVVPGTARELRARTGLKVVSNPEFTSEGNGVRDTLEPSRVIIGSAEKKPGDLVEEIWSFAKSPVIRTNNENAELIKYASNAFLATKISFINEIANLCERIPGCDVDVIAKGMGLDRRIAPYFLKAGIGYGGSCFPKDTNALASFAREKGERMSVIEAAIKVNEERIDRVIEHIRSSVKDIHGKRIGVLGAAFKEDTDDVRESQAVRLMERLGKEKAIVVAYDPMAKSIPVPGVMRVGSVKECVEGSDVVVVATEWPQFRKIGQMAGRKPVIDARRVLDRNDFKNFRAIGLGNDED